MLNFNPDLRISAEEALKNQIFDEIRNKSESVEAENLVQCKNHYKDTNEAV